MIKTTKAALATASALLLGLSAIAVAQHPAIPAPKISFAGQQQGEIPFELYRGNRVVLTAKVNGQSTHAILDTGASATTLDRAYARSIGIPEGIKINAKGAGGNVDAELVSGVTLEIGGLRMDNMSVAVMDLSMVSQQIGRPVTIVVGRELFNSTAIEFNWAQSKLAIIPADRFEPAKGATILPVERRGPFNFVKLSIAGLPAIDALLDLGNGGNLKLPSDYWTKQPTLSGLRYAESQGGGVGGVHASRSVILPTVDFAGQRFEGVPGNLGGDSHGHQPQLGSNLGIGMLKQFDLTLDLGRDRIILKPLANPPGFDRDRAGLRASPDGAALGVMFVSPQGPAAKAGLKAGDRIVAINGQPIGKDFFSTPAGRWNLASAGTPVTLTLEDGRSVHFALTDFY